MNIVTIIFTILVMTGAGLLFFSWSGDYSQPQAVVGILLIAIAMLLGRFYRD